MSPETTRSSHGLEGCSTLYVSPATGKEQSPTFVEDWDMKQISLRGS